MHNILKLVPWYVHLFCTFKRRHDFIYCKYIKCNATISIRSMKRSPVRPSVSNVIAGFGSI